MLIDMIIGIGLVAMFWCLTDKYNVWDKLYIKLLDKIKWLPKSVCVICISFWLLLVYFLIVEGSLEIVKALACTPFVLELTHRIWQR